MKRVLWAFFIPIAISAMAAVPGQIDSVCAERCSILAVEKGSVRFIDEWLDRNLVLGRYVATARQLIPGVEAPIRDLRSPNLWRVVASNYLDHENGEIGMRLRLFGPDGSLRETEDAFYLLEQTDMGYLFGGTDAIFAITTNEEHAYNTLTQIWFLPERGDPKPLLEMVGTYEKFNKQAGGRVPGVTVARQTYDGVNASTKGTIEEFYRWDPRSKSLTYISRAPHPYRGQN